MTKLQIIEPERRTVSLLNDKLYKRANYHLGLEIIDYWMLENRFKEIGKVEVDRKVIEKSDEQYQKHFIRTRRGVYFDFASRTIPFVTKFNVVQEIKRNKVRKLLFNSTACEVYGSKKVVKVCREAGIKIQPDAINVIDFSRLDDKIKEKMFPPMLSDFAAALTISKRAIPFYPSGMLPSEALALTDLNSYLSNYCSKEYSKTLESFLNSGENIMFNEPKQLKFKVCLAYFFTIARHFSNPIEFQKLLNNVREFEGSLNGETTKRIDKLVAEFYVKERGKIGKGTALEDIFPFKPYESKELMIEIARKICGNRQLLEEVKMRASNLPHFQAISEDFPIADIEILCSTPLDGGTKIKSNIFCGSMMPDLRFFGLSYDITDKDAPINKEREGLGSDAYAPIREIILDAIIKRSREAYMQHSLVNQRIKTRLSGNQNVGIEERMLEVLKNQEIPINLKLMFYELPVLVTPVNYELLGVAPGATKEEIDKAYKKKAREVHPDLHPGEEKHYEALFKELNAARKGVSSKYDVPDKEIAPSPFSQIDKITRISELFKQNY